jgi:HlyD family type I secretion membrane fusion protein
MSGKTHSRAVKPIGLRPMMFTGAAASFWLGGVSAYITGYLRAQELTLATARSEFQIFTGVVALLPPVLFFVAGHVFARWQPDRNAGWLAAISRRIASAHASTTRRLRLADPALTAGLSTGDDLAFADTRGLIRTGGTIVLVFVVGFFGWAALAPLNSAMLAPGVIVVESHRKTIQHLEGGIVRDVRVAENDQVKAGQPLIELDDTQARATLGLLQGEADALSATEARLIAERDGAGTITFPPELLARESDPKVAEAVRGEERTFRNRRETMIKQIAILTSHAQENARTIEGLKAQRTALDTQLALIDKETVIIQQLVNKGIEAMPRLLALQRSTADLAGQRGQVVEKIAQVEVSTGETQLQIVNQRNQFQSDVLKDLRDVQTKRFDFLDRIHGAQDVMNRMVMTAPVGGRVVGLAAHTRGAVIRAGDTVLEIVPDQDELQVEAHVRPEDINEVQVGLSAKVDLTAYKQRRLPLITGAVTAVSADRLVDQHTGQAYFSAQISVDPESWKDYPEVRLIPGMPVEVAVENGSRTALEYFVTPIQAVFRRGMRER